MNRKAIIIAALVFLLLIAGTFFYVQFRPKPSSSNDRFINQPTIICNSYSDLAEAEKKPADVCILDLSGKQLTDLPQSIYGMVNLQTLVLSDNQLSKLNGEGFSKLVNLKNLILDHNAFTMLPGQVFVLKNLETLDLSSNKISELPPNFHFFYVLRKLKILNLEGNRFDSKTQKLVKSVLTKAAISF